jgi:hypothetical protein
MIKINFIPRRPIKDLLFEIISVTIVLNLLYLVIKSLKLRLSLQNPLFESMSIFIIFKFFSLLKTFLFIINFTQWIVVCLFKLTLEQFDILLSITGP